MEEATSKPTYEVLVKQFGKLQDKNISLHKQNISLRTNMAELEKRCSQLTKEKSDLETKLDYYIDKRC